MFKSMGLSSVLLLSGFVLLSETATADPIFNEITVVCPTTQGSPNSIANFGDYIGGYGVEFILSQTLQVYFRSTGSVKDIPSNLMNYFNDSINYNSASGNVICSYQSNNPIDSRFTVTYTLTNGLGGSVLSQSNNSINIILPTGLKD